MVLQKALQSSKNLGDLTQVWIREITARTRAENVVSTVKLTVGDTASLVAPAALVAEVVLQTGLADKKTPLRVLLIGRDPMIRLDHSVWASLAGDMIGRPGQVVITLTHAEQAITSMYPVAQALRLPHCNVMLPEQILAAGQPNVDLAIWVHPAAEVDSPEEQKHGQIALHLHKNEVPVVACLFNETDLHGQNIILSSAGLSLVPFGEGLKRGSKAINRFGISSRNVGLEGGWGAVLCHLTDSEVRRADNEVALVKAALSLLRLEGGIASSWALGQRINGVAFNRIIPIGLLGNMAVEPTTGHLLAHDDESNRLAILGHLWNEKRKAMPSGGEELLIWAAGVKLSFGQALPKETEKRKSAISALEHAFDQGALDAGIALARGYEATGHEESREKALQLYRRIDTAHPLSAYALAHGAVSSGEQATALRCFGAAAEAGYPLAMSDLAVFVQQMNIQGIDPWALLAQAAQLGDPDANVYLAERELKAERLQPSLEYLRQAWQIGHKEALNFAFNLATFMQGQKLGNRHKLKQELRDIENQAKKVGVTLTYGGV
ncbi:MULTISPECIES: sel1 repeat family protein [Pseudomonas]|uniref:sel1 repeat family protein n=1 Tax=Pseudomonas TaxID=286 RepID=UPI00031FFE13|nr:MULTISPECIES: sel1 repeat family protein [Pseudomonas]HDV4147604.1 sel1 repeat family protein [Pseudomonas aeruginosa]